MPHDNDILCQMIVTTANGERVLFFDSRRRVTEGGEDRETLEAARFENLMKLGVITCEEGPMRAASFEVSVAS